MCCKNSEGLPSVCSPVPTGSQDFFFSIVQECNDSDIDGTFYIQTYVPILY